MTTTAERMEIRLDEGDVRNLLSGRESWNVDQLTTIARLLDIEPSTLVRAAQDAQVEL